jgi:hypothetical protein
VTRLETMIRIGVQDLRVSTECLTLPMPVYILRMSESHKVKSAIHRKSERI